MPIDLMFEIHKDLPREGPGCLDATRRAFEMLPWLPAEPRLLDIACGPGMQTLHLAQMSDARITAVDTHEPFLACLRANAETSGFANRITVLNRSMFTLKFDQPFDVIWCEGAIYIIGFEEGLKAWKPLLKPGGYLAATEISWLKPGAPQACRAFWERDYPAMQSVEGNLQRIERQGYRLLGHFTLPESAWWQHYYTPLEARLKALRRQYAGNAEALEVLAGTQAEIDLYRRYSEWYGYEFYVMQK